MFCFSFSLAVNFTLLRKEPPVHADDVGFGARSRGRLRSGSSSVAVSSRIFSHTGTTGDGEITNEIESDELFAVWQIRRGNQTGELQEGACEIHQSQSRAQSLQGWTQSGGCHQGPHPRWRFAQAWPAQLPHLLEEAAGRIRSEASEGRQEDCDEVKPFPSDSPAPARAGAFFRTDVSVSAANAQLRPCGTTQKHSCAR